MMQANSVGSATFSLPSINQQPRLSHYSVQQQTILMSQRRKFQNSKFDTLLTWLPRATTLEAHFLDESYALFIYCFLKMHDSDLSLIHI